MDGGVRQIEVDSSSTASEVVLQISKNVGVTDPFGFAIFIKLFDKVGYVNKCKNYEINEIFAHR